MKTTTYKLAALSVIFFGTLIAAAACAPCSAQVDAQSTTEISVKSKLETSTKSEPATKETARHWPSFLGIGATKLTPSRLPTNWSHEKNISWNTKLVGAGQSSPVIWNDQVFVTSIDGDMKDNCVVTSISLIDGETLWSHETPSSQPVRSNYYQSRSAPTPVVDQDRVYSLFETGKLIALDHKGEEAWARSLTDDYGAFEVRIGLAASLAQTHSVGQRNRRDGLENRTLQPPKLHLTYHSLDCGRAPNRLQLRRQRRWLRHQNW